MTLARKRKPTIPCELCRYYKQSKQDDEMMCRKFRYHVTERDGCTMGEVKETAC